MPWWTHLRDWMRGTPAEAPPAETATPAKKTPGPARWIAADANPFGVPVLDLASITGGFLSTSKDPAEAERSLSWGTRTGASLDGTRPALSRHPCALHYPAGLLEEGLLAVPAAMEDKWVLAWRNDQILAARSWTGAVVAVGACRRTDTGVEVTEVVLLETTLSLFGDPVQTFDWLVRTLALGEAHPLPVDEEGAGLLAAVPLSIFGPFGRAAACAARGWDPSPARRPLRTDSALVLAAATGDLERARDVLKRSVLLNAPSRFEGYTALHIASARGAHTMVSLLLESGALPDPPSDRGMTPLMVALVHGAPASLLDVLVSHGADPLACNIDGFDALHAIAETNRAELLPWVLSKGAALERRTGRMHTALQIAAALGHVEALQALLEAGADPAGPGDTARGIAIAENQPATVAALDAWAQRTGPDPAR